VPDSALLTCKEVAAWLRISPSALVRMRRSGELPYLRFNGDTNYGRVRYIREDVEAFLAAAKVRTLSFGRPAPIKEKETA
jgi:excisionase family DNA binding protein